MFHIHMQPEPTDRAVEIPDEHLHSHKIDAVPSEEPTRWWTYLLEVAGTTKQQDIAAKAGIDQSHLSRWKSGYPPSVPFVIKVAEAYGRNILEAFVAADILTDEQAQLREVRVVDPSGMTDDELLAELTRRFRSRGDDESLAGDDQE